MFAEPLVKEWQIHTVVQFYCALFLILPENTPLDVAVLEEFCDLDFDAVLVAWIDRAIKREQGYRHTFSGHLPKLYDEEDPQKLFTLHLLFREGALATLNLQCIILKNFIRKHLDEKQDVYARDLLSLLQSQRQEAVGPYIAKAYSQAMSQPTLELRMQKAVGTKRGASLSASESLGAALGKVPTLEEIGKRTLYSPEKAREELFSVLLQRCSQHAQLVLRKDEFAFRADFREMVDARGPDRFRQRLVLKALIAQASTTPKKMTTVILRNCAILDGELLAPLLSADLQILDVSGCPAIVDADIATFSQRCPNLQELYLSGCSRLRSVDPYLSKYHLFPHLVTLHANNCARLAVLGLHAPFLRTLECKHNPSLSTVYLRSRNWAQIDDKGSPAILYQSFFYEGSYFPNFGPIRDGVDHAFSHLTEFPDGVFTHSLDKQNIVLRDSQTGLLKHALQQDQEIRALLAIAEDRLVCATRSRVNILDRSTGDILCAIPEGAMQLAFMPQDKLVTVMGKKIKIWDILSGSVIDVIEENEAVLCVAIDGESLVYATSREINKWENRQKTVLYFHKGDVHTLKGEKIKNFAVSKDGKLVIQTCCVTRVFDIKKQSVLWGKKECEDDYYISRGIWEADSRCLLLNLPPLILSDDVVVYVSYFWRAAYRWEDKRNNKIGSRHPKIDTCLIRFFDINTGNCLRTANTLYKPSCLLKLSDERLLVSASHGVGVWDFRIANA